MHRNVAGPVLGFPDRVPTPHVDSRRQRMIFACVLSQLPTP
jgi:hypothetical protein